MKILTQKRAFVAHIQRSVNRTLFRMFRSHLTTLEENMYSLAGTLGRGTTVSARKNSPQLLAGPSPKLSEQLHLKVSPFILGKVSTVMEPMGRK